MKVKIPYSPRPYQRNIHNDKSRFKVLVLHRRAGKTVCAINELVKMTVTCTHKNPQGGYIAPSYSMAKRIAWKYLKEFTETIPGMDYNKSELTATFPNNATITLYGADNPDSLRGMYFDAVVIDEMGEINPKLWDEVIRPTLMDRQGTALFLGTPKGKNRFYELYEQAKDLDDWSSTLLKWDDTNILPIAEIQSAKKEMSEAAFKQELECSFTASIRGAYYADEMDQAITNSNVPYDKSLSVYTSWDLGLRDTMVVIFWQVLGSEIRVIDCLDFQSTSLLDVAKIVNDQPYPIEYHIMPHDIKVRELTTGKSRLEVLTKLGMKIETAPNLSIMDGIEASRTMLPRVLFDKVKCKVLVEALRMYRTEYNDRLAVYKAQPLHDWTSHYTDAVRYFAVTPIKSSVNSGKYSDWAVSLN